VGQTIESFIYSLRSRPLRRNLNKSAVAAVLSSEPLKKLFLLVKTNKSAVWLAIAGKDAVSKVFGIYFPIMAFVASGFEHSVANMYLIPIGLFLKGDAAVVNAAGLAEKVNSFTWSAFLIGNLVPATLGNIIGGAFFVGGVYYFAYLRKK
jgi:formate/nitrite transporter FocA (FNT family)